jgi:arylsulfatase A-like enzyme
LPAEYLHSLPAQDTTLAEALVKNGYKTFFAGKWHLGGEGSYPEDHGFEINKGGWEKGSPIGGYFSPWENPKLPNIEDGENLSMRLAEETAVFITQQKDSAFFAFLSFYAVHGPIQTTHGKWKKYREKATGKPLIEKGYRMERVLPIRQVQDNPVYAGLMESMDDAVGIVLRALLENGLENNTIVVFTSDNGGVSSGDSFSTSNLPLRGGKGYQWEGGLREPYIIKVPWLKSGSHSTDFPVTGTDFYPTLLDLANIGLMPDQHVDGVSLKPLLEGKKMVLERPLFWHYPHYGNQGGNPSSIIQENGWKLIHYWEDGSNELYDLRADPGEQYNVAAKNPDTTENMAEKLLDWLTQVGANMPEMDKEYNADLAKKYQEKIIDEMLPALEESRKEVLSEDFAPNLDWWGSQVTRD